MVAEGCYSLYSARGRFASARNSSGCYAHPQPASNPIGRLPNPVHLPKLVLRQLDIYGFRGFVRGHAEARLAGKC